MDMDTLNGINFAFLGFRTNMFKISELASTCNIWASAVAIYVHSIVLFILNICLDRRKVPIIIIIIGYLM